jgi:uncharacterized Zn ribbon protein
MTKRIAVMAATLAVLTLGAGTTLLAHEGHDHKVMGTLTSATADKVVVKDTSGKDVTIQVTKDTKVKAKPAMTVEQIKPGTRVVVTALMDKDKSMKAKLIEVGVAATTTATPTKAAK